MKEKSVKSLARSLTVWLNFLFENPSSCGCDPARFIGESDGSDLSLGGEAREVLLSNGKRESGPGRRVGFDGLWRGPKRQRDLSWRGDGSDEVGQDGFLGSTFSGLKTSLQEICSFEDLKERMRMYLSLGSCKEIFEALTQVTKNIDEGRLKMRASCPIVSDVGMKEKAVRILMSYNPIWLRIGLYVILGGDSLLPNGDVNSEQENAFLRMVLEKQFLSHTGLAKAHAYNKQVEGLYRPGYYEKLGNVILKRFLLLVIIIDRAKSQTSLPLKYGIDGLDGGSPPLFSLKSSIKSSRQLIIDFLSSDVMHGEGNVLAHLVIVGYKVTYQQNPLIEYDFRVTDLFEDLRDGVRLCRAIQLKPPSILMKVVVPSDTQKKSLVNCGIALQYLKQAGVPLLDEDGTEILGEDVVNGDKELTLSLLWNLFVHLQLPLLISKTLILEEISNIRGVAVESSSTQTLLDLLLSWIQVLQVSDILEHNGVCNGQSVMVLLVFLSVQLLVKRNMDKLNFHKLLGFGCQGPNSTSSSTEWNNDKARRTPLEKYGMYFAFMVDRHHFVNLKKSITVIQKATRAWIAQRHCEGSTICNQMQNPDLINAATVIQSCIRGHIAKSAYAQRVVSLKEKGSVMAQDDIGHFAATKIPSHYRGWLMRKSFACKKGATRIIQRSFRSSRSRRYFQIQRQQNASVIIIQSHVRGWLSRRQAYREIDLFIRIQSFWKGYCARKNARGQLLNLRLRMEKSAANVDDRRRLINRLVAALSELLSMRSVSGILHTCATLDVATELSQKCCEELVAAGAVGTLLKLIRSVSRSIPDQQVLKHALSTLRNLARYPHLTEILVQSHGCVETILLEFVRNKEEGYFVASELLKKICVSKNGAKAIRSSPALFKRLNNFAEELARKARNDKRNERNLPAREHAERRLKEVVELLKLIANANANANA
ncbi:Abnormal spindle-like microcephaly-associated protein [Sesamum angolense]|uniref:Abnormal spindle-like microcephaly-associated protein n=1 Tax=Sesamum angolense TaxID=2727404 RepID=A0AAE1WSP9_9LAMI|nr:Abnormal spindle-like microcephaly-associated protein [Sesamum angolense]